MTPVASASLAFGLSASFVNSSVSPGSTSFRRKSLPLVIRNGFANSRALLMISFVFIIFSFVRIEHRQLAHYVFSFGEPNGTKVQWTAGSELAASETRFGNSKRFPDPAAGGV